MIQLLHMYLKKLELNGFKSFASPIIMEFPLGVTAIVGPNGSGKSNIADAVRWILGEQSMKNVRSQSSRDLIFSGSKNKKKLGRATAALYFDNQSGHIPLDYSEVVISKNIFRDGNSEYFINKNPTKLMNVVEILAKANIGHRGFSVINQGMESEILNYSPKELHELLEEASGVRYLQLKKRRSERRLKASQTNFEKISSILAELSPHLRYLKREATKVERREKLKKELIHLKREFFSLKLFKLSGHERDFEKNKNDLKEKVLKIKKEINEREQDLKDEELAIREEREKFINVQKELERIFNKRTELNEQLMNIKFQIQTEKQKQPTEIDKQIKFNLKQAEDEFEHILLSLRKIIGSSSPSEIKSKANQIIERIEKLIGKNEDVSKIIKNSNVDKLDRLIGEQKEIQELLDAIDKDYKKQRAGLKISQDQSKQEKFFELERTLRKKKDELSELENKIKEIGWIGTQRASELNEFKQQIKDEKVEIDDIKKTDAAKTTDEFLRQLDEKINRLKYKLEEIGGVDDITLQEYKETKERYENLSIKLKDLKQAKQDLEILIKQLTQEIRTQFDKNFQVINDNFNKYFRLLFGGGKGYLRKISNFPPKADQPRADKLQIASEEDMDSEEEREISNGIEIKATLPGKKIKDLRMFSGGEKALTSIALIFAIVSSNPPPFLVLDEVDATLDETNARRFAKLLGEFRKNTQFVIVTHNRETMNQADVLYGVTMGEDGVSSLLSLKLEK